MINWLVILLSTIVSSVLYRAGGLAKDSPECPWIPKWMRKSWIRDWIIPMVCILAIWITCHIGISLWWLLFYGLTGGALTTYWDWLFKDKDNFWFAGFMVGIATFPLIFCGLHWYMVLARALVLAVLWGGWCAIFKNSTVEECGRGAFITATIPLLMI